MVERIARRIGGWRNVPLFLSIGWFVLTVPLRLRKHDVRTFVRDLRRGKRPLGPQETIERLCAFWMWRFFPGRNTCYVRSMIVYRFIDAPPDQLRLHMGIERRENLAERLRGHAWVSLGGRIIYGPPVVYEGRLREIALDSFTQ